LSYYFLVQTSGKSDKFKQQALCIINSVHKTVRKNWFIHPARRDISLTAFVLSLLEDGIDVLLFKPLKLRLLLGFFASVAGYLVRYAFIDSTDKRIL